MFLYPSLPYFVNHSRVEQGRGVTKIKRFALGYLSQYPAHDLSTARLGQSAYELDLIGFGYWPYQARYSMCNVLPGERLVVLMLIEDHVGIDALAFDVVRVANYCAFYNAGVPVDGILYFRSAYTVPANIQHVINPSRDPIVTVKIAQAAITCKV
jgi:hypothetical protein